jgi:CSLREA domain-containing protein
MKMTGLLGVAALALALPVPSALGHPTTATRAQATTFTVATTADAPHALPLDGNCTSTLPGGACTLRAAIQAANVLGDGPHTLNLSTAGTYALTVVGPNEDAGAIGDLDINGTSVVIANTSGGRVGIDGNHTDRVIGIGRRGPAQVTITGVTIENGLLEGAPSPLTAGGGVDIATGSAVTFNNVIFVGNRTVFAGGGLANAGLATLNDVTFSGNTAVFSGGFGNLAVTTLNNVVFSGNFGSFSNGGFGNLGLATLTNVLVTKNAAGFLDGGVANGDKASLTMTNVTISRNQARLNGGVGNLGKATLTNVTISQNTASDFSPGLGNLGTATLTNVTISGNTGGGSVGGIASGLPLQGRLRPVANILGILNISVPEPGPTILRNTIVDSPLPAACAVPIGSSGSNLEFPGNTCGFLPLLGDLVGRNPLLGRLVSNGGFAPTQALLPRSPAIDAARAECPSTDQRNVARPQGRRCDVGAYERKKARKKK